MIPTIIYVFLMTCLFGSLLFFIYDFFKDVAYLVHGKKRDKERLERIMKILKENDKEDNK